MWEVCETYLTPVTIRYTIPAMVSGSGSGAKTYTKL